MRKKVNKDAMSVNAIAGTYVVLLGIDMKKEATKDLLGFAIERTDHTENEKYWLKGFKTFEKIDQDIKTGSQVSTFEYPIQGFLWGDYTAKPNHKYTYKIVALKGAPKNLKQAETVKVGISTENEDKGTHSIFFNMGIAASQAYIRKFGNKLPDEVPNRQVWKWLSRGLEEAILKFIYQAKGEGYGIRAALYEFQYEPVLKAFKEVSESGVDVKVIVDSKENAQNYPNEKNKLSIEKADLSELVIKRISNSSYISHNKFIILLKNGKPVQVWTGSTNITEGGIFGHSNVGHLVRDREIAAGYLSYWNELSNDPEASTFREFNEKLYPIPEQLPVEKSTITIFSPRKSLEALEFYVNLMDNSNNSVFLTAAFGVNNLFEQVLAEDKDYLRYVLLEKEDNNMEVIKRDQDNRIAVGSIVEENLFNRWVKERTIPNLNNHVKFIHTKYMLIDPLCSNPTVITGSANFSNASTKNNDENMLIICGDTRVADIYLGEFMRLFNHYYFRQFIKAHKYEDNTVATRYLSPNDSWCTPYYKEGSVKFKERVYFSGTTC